MGMAASQARFLGLTARKNNVEFEGQQINQQRTALSNQSANYYNDLLGMSVPIPPSVDDYTKTVYTFNDGALTNQITAMMAQNNGSYKISYLRQWVDDFSVVSATTSIVNFQAGDPTLGIPDVYRVGSKVLRNMGDEIGFYATYKDASGADCAEFVDYRDGKFYVAGTTTEFEFQADWTECKFVNSFSYDFGGDEYLDSLSPDQIIQLQKEEQEYLAMLQQKYGPGDYMVRYVKNTTTEEWEPYFYRLQDLESDDTIYDDNGNSLSNINCYKIGSETKAEEVKVVEDCHIEKDSTGRYINITIPQHDSEGNLIEGSEVTYALTTSTVTDQARYDDAMNQYEFDKYQYDQTIQEINAKIKIIQAEDKNLELRLKQLDTEQRAISTELDAVSQVIQKNTESSFKTFG